MITKLENNSIDLDFETIMEEIFWSHIFKTILSCNEIYYPDFYNDTLFTLYDVL
jgi:hypothetical protein